MDRVDVIYICSNAAIATQNVNRLNVSDTDGFSIATRLTYLPRQVRSLRKNKVNFISLTPGTAFDHARSRGGHADERRFSIGCCTTCLWRKMNGADGCA